MVNYSWLSSYIVCWATGAEGAGGTPSTPKSRCNSSTVYYCSSNEEVIRHHMQMCSPTRPPCWKIWIWVLAAKREIGATRHHLHRAAETPHHLLGGLAGSFSSLHPAAGAPPSSGLQNPGTVLVEREGHSPCKWPDRLLNAGGINTITACP